MTNAQKIARKLRILIAEKDFSKKEVADAVGIDPTTLSNHLKGKYAPNAEVLPKYAELLGVTIDYLLFDDPNEFPRYVKAPAYAGDPEKYRKIKEEEKPVETQDAYYGDFADLIKEISKLPLDTQRKLLETFRLQLDLARGRR